MNSMNRQRNRNNRLKRLETRLDVVAQRDSPEPVTIDAFVRGLRSFRTDLFPKLRSSIQVVLIADYMNRHAEALIAQIDSHDRILLSRFTEIENEWQRLFKILLDAIVTQYLDSMKHGATSIEGDEVTCPTVAPCLYVEKRATTDELAVAVATRTLRSGVVSAIACLTEFPFTAVRTMQESEPAAIEVAMQQLAEVTGEMAFTDLESIDL